MAPEPEGTAPIAAGRLDDRILRTLERLPGRVAFSGLRRLLRAHPESLARALRRLEREGLVDREDGGYRALREPPRPLTELTSGLHPVAQVELPPGAPTGVILGRLSGRWFGSLRWVGTVERPEGRLLAWAGRDFAGFVLLGIEARTMRVYVPGAARDDEAEASEEAAYELLVHAADALRPVGTSHGGRVTYLSASGPLGPGGPSDN